MNAVVYYETLKGGPGVQRYEDIEDIKFRTDGLWVMGRDGRLKTAYNNRSWVSVNIYEYDPEDD